MWTLTCRSARGGRFSVAAAVAISMVPLWLAVPAASGQQVEWVEWSFMTGDDPLSTIGGTFAGAGINVLYGGAADTSGLGHVWVPASTYQHGEIQAPPATVWNTVVLADYAQGQRVGFHDNEFQPVSVTNLVIAISGLGQNGLPVEWAFNRPFTILSSGPGYDGPGELTALPNNVLRGENGNGLIQLIGTFSVFTWLPSPGDDGSRFSIAIIPSPSTAGAALVLLGATSRRRR